MLVTSNKTHVGRKKYIVSKKVENNEDKEEEKNRYDKGKFAI